jgi:hypothetical protein
MLTLRIQMMQEPIKIMNLNNEKWSSKYVRVNKDGVQMMRS